MFPPPDNKEQAAATTRTIGRFPRSWWDSRRRCRLSWLAPRGCPSRTSTAKVL